MAALRLLDRRQVHRVLVVDDQEEARRLIRRVMEAHGAYTVSEAESASEAITCMAREPFDLIILDLMMPEMDGFSLVERIKADESTREIPIVVVTAKEVSPEERERLAGKIDRLMMKGDFLDDELLREIDRALS